VPPVNTPATGMAQFQLSSDGKEINYDLSATNLNGFMMAHIHQGKTGENGQPVTAPLSMGFASSFEYYHLKKYMMNQSLLL
jgi:hypothetical protein